MSKTTHSDSIARLGSVAGKVPAIEFYDAYKSILNSEKPGKPATMIVFSHPSFDDDITVIGDITKINKVT